MRRARRVSTGATWLAIAVAAAGAWAPARADAANVVVSGPLEISWQGDRARGCAAAGLCGVVGSIEISTANAGAGGSGVPIEVADEGAVARVAAAGAAGAAPVSCADAVPVDFLLRVAGGSAVVDRAGPNGLPSSGRCGGPTALDMEALTLPARRTSRGYDLTGDRSFSAGPFTISIASGLTARVTRSHGIGLSLSGGGSGRTHSRSKLVESATIAYSVASVAGAFRLQYGGLPSPDCIPFGACGASGTISGTLSGRGGTVAIFGSRVVKRAIGRSQALSDLRAGRLRTFDSSLVRPIGGNLTAAFSEPGPPPCSDRTNTSLPLSSRVRGGAEELTLLGGSRSVFFGFGGPDPLRTRCPGPSSEDVLGGGGLASAQLPLRSFGAPALSVNLGGGGTFDGLSYRGSRGASATMVLRLLHSRGGTRRVRVP